MFGKTRVALKCLKSFVDKYPQIRFLVVVPTDNLKVQWNEQLDAWGLSLNGQVEIINTVAKRAYTTDILVIDEVHRSNATVFKQIFENVKYKYILGLTATYERLDGLHKEVTAKYCPVIDEITLAEASINGWVSPFKEYQVLIDVDDIDVYEGYNRAFVENFEYFNFDWDVVNQCLGKTGYIYRSQLRDKLCPNGSEEQRKAVMQAITYKATAFMRAVQQRKAFINNHPKKIELAREIIQARPNSKIITFSNNIKMAEAIGCGGLVYTGKDSKKKARANLEDFNNQTTGIIHSVKKLDEGMDCRGLDTAIILGLDSSKTKATQRRGRTIRQEEGKNAEIFNLIINNTVETKWFKSSHEGTDYITIDEEGLRDVLAGRTPKPYKQPIKNYQFRF